MPDGPFQSKRSMHTALALLKRSFITANMPIYTYNVKGDRIADYPYIQDDCYYGGYVEDALDSQAFLSTCFGLWGHVQIGILGYEIEPIENSSTFQHLIYRKTPEHLEPCRGIIEDGTYLGSEAGEIRIIDSDGPIPSAIGIYLPLGLHLYLVGLELWTERDYITIDTENLSVTLAAFHQYAISELQQNVHFDHSGIITNPKVDAETIAHVLGHSLGFGHDDTPLNKARGCDCNCTKPGRCIMAATGNPTCSRLSNCSRMVYYDAIRKPGKECLTDIPSHLVSRKKCGNGVIEDDEECDCGHDEECQRNGCCQKDCKLSPGIECLYGLCCERCKLLEEGTVCREAVSECDLPEYCNGSSPVCPPDVHKQDGMPCSNSNSCFMGNCIDLHKHCTSLFGQGAKQAPLSCFKKVNMRGDQAGNCGEDGQKYRKCYEEDVLCGRLQCTHVNKIPKMLTGQRVVQIPVEGTFCWGFEFHVGQHVYDLGAVRDGTTCGTDKICMNRSCVDRAILNYDCDFSKCSNRGVCNSKRNCHCSYGWAPPFCSGRGFGGSTDSGPPPRNWLPVSL
ncbi:disintegrin and metalloproteinase domain-containing protein 9-like [Zootoca vivipara]|uniref:disintegrin and metalloproteinase domain-containing protein 9-like n=1 Tax=Zootoca vivipara TaxID=8524 RepID=UPI00293BDAF9|nr:disintegrin and metalloproteinase domain-containing protein 9-like [Zootoca vivipara]